MIKSSRSRLCLLLVLAAASLHALSPEEWKFRQTLGRNSEGPLRFSLPAGTLDTAQPDLRDLRLLDSAGKEVPYLLMRPTLEPEKAVAPKNLQAELTDTDTIVTLETGTEAPLESVELQTNAARFMKPVQIELSADGAIWQTLSEGTPLFRQEGATRTSLPLGYRTAAFVRLTLGDERTKPIVITGATLHTVERHTAFTEEFTPRITRTDQFAGESVITLDLGAKNLTLASLEFSAEDALFTRNVTVAVREFAGGQVTERVLARGAIFRVELDPFTPATDMRLAVNATVPSRELILHLENADNPPLHIYRIVAERHPVHAVAVARTPGDLVLLTGNSSALSPRYDLGGATARLADLPLSNPPIDEPLDNPNYQQADTGNGVLWEDAPANLGAWKFRRPLAATTDGVQEVELDLHVLANAQDSFADLRLIQNKKQIPYVIERTGLARELILTSDMTLDPKRPSVSQWQFKLPQGDLFLAGGVLTSQTAQFERRIRVFETRSGPAGEQFPHLLAEPTWIHAPNEKPVPLAFNINQRLDTDTVWVETDNGSDIPISIDDFRVRFPSIRILFKTVGNSPVDLYYGNDQAGAPHQDPALVAAALLPAMKNVATLGPVVQAAKGTQKLVLLEQKHRNVFLWTGLALAAAAIVAVTIRVAFKKPAPPENP